MSKLNFTLNPEGFEPSSDLLGHKTEKIHSVFEDFRKRVNSFQDNFVSRRSEILNSASSIALETKLHNPDASVNIYDYSKILAVRAWEKTKGLISEAVGSNNFAEQLLKLDILDNENENSSQYTAAVIEDRLDTIPVYPTFKRRSWRESDRFNNSKERSLRKFSLRLNYLDREIISRSSLSEEQGGKFSVKVKYSSLENLAKTKSFYPEDQNYDNVINLLNRASLDLSKELDKNPKGELRAQLDTLAKPVSDKINSEIISEINSNIFPLEERLASDNLVSSSNGVNVDLESLEKSILDLEQENTYQQVAKLLKNRLAYLYIPASYLKNSNTPEKVLLFVKSKFIGYLDFGAEQKKLLSLLVQDYYRVASTFGGSLASSAKAGFVIKLERLATGTRKFRERAHYYTGQSKSYLNDHIRPGRYTVNVAGALIICFGALTLFSLPATRDALSHLSSRLMEVKFAFSSAGSHDKSRNFAKYDPSKNIGKLKPIKSADNPLWVVIPTSSHTSEKTSSTATGLTQSGTALSTPSLVNDLDKQTASKNISNESSATEINQSFNLGLQLFLDKSSPEHIQQGLKLIEGAAHNNFAPAQHQMGKIYNSGLGVKKDTQKAKKWFLIAADSDYAPAMYELGVISYSAGTREASKAVDWFTKAANRGVVDSQYNLGVMYLKGLGVPQNLKEAYKWFSVASMQGDQQAIEKRDEIKAHLLLEEMDQAQETASTFKTAPSMERIF